KCQRLRPRGRSLPSLAARRSVWRIEQVQLGHRETSFDEDVNTATGRLALVRRAPALPGSRLAGQDSGGQQWINTGACHSAVEPAADCQGCIANRLGLQPPRPPAAQQAAVGILLRRLATLSGPHLV